MSIKQAKLTSTLSIASFSPAVLNYFFSVNSCSPKGTGWPYMNQTEKRFSKSFKHSDAAICLSPLTSAGWTFSCKHLNFGIEAETFSKIGHMYLFQTNHKTFLNRYIYFAVSLTLICYINTDLRRKCPSERSSPFLTQILNREKKICMPFSNGSL